MGIKYYLKNDIKDIREMLVSDIRLGRVRLKGKMKGKKRGGNLNVIFLCQFVPVWNKIRSIYETMLKDSHITTHIVCIPLDLHNKKENSAYLWFTQHGYNAINAVKKNGRWFDLKKLAPDYVFYTRPYNAFLPKGYNSRCVSCYARVCNLLYSMPLIKDSYKNSFNSDFCRDVSIFFAESEYSRKAFIKKFPVSTLFGIRKAFFLGTPVLEQLLKDKGKETDIWNFYKEGNLKIIWTPRWVSDATVPDGVGGSNFFIYYEEIIHYAEKHKDISLLCRPHPLMFDNFARTGELKKGEAEEYKALIAATKNVSLDISEEYNQTFWSSDVLVSDISGITVEYFWTGKPIIFCPSAKVLEAEFIPYAKEMLRGCYVAKTKEETFFYLEQLRKGHDPLRNVRKEIMKSLTGNRSRNASTNIAKQLLEMR